MLSFKVHSNAWKRIFIQVSLWKESLEGHWVCVSDVYRGQGQETQ